YLTASFEGESRDPQEVYRLLCDEITRLREEGLPRDAFERCKKATYGRYISMYCKPDAVAGVMLMTHFCGMDNMYDLPAEVRAMTIDDLTERLMEDFDPQYSAVSIIKPLK
ncbi:MAG: insulinase family protein, partial [Angelakisella sp.]